MLDIQVTLTDGTERDCLKKMYMIGPQLVLGFAGSVAIGLEIVAQLTHALQAPEEEGASGIHNTWQTQSRKASEGCSLTSRNTSGRSAASSFLSAHPNQNDGAAPWARCFVHRFRAPGFEPDEAAQAQIVSIGSGSDIEPYKAALDRLGRDMQMLQLEVSFPGGSGIALMYSITKLLQRSPASGISRHLHLCLVGRHEVRIATNHVQDPRDPEKTEEMPSVATNMEELQRLLGEQAASILETATC